MREGIISKEYGRTSLREKDAEDLAQRVALTLLGKRAGQSDPNCLPCVQLSGNSGENAKNGAVSLRTRNLTDDVRPAGIPPETPGLPSETRRADEMAEAAAAPAPEGIGDDHENPEEFYTVERDESGEVVYLCSDMGEAYDKIAALAEYLLKDHQDAPVDEHFAESLFWDGGAVEGPGGCAEAKTWAPCSEGPEAKRQRLAHPPALCIVSGDPLAVSLGPGQEGTDFHLQILVATVERSPEAHGSPAAQELWCIPHHRGNLQMIVAFEDAQEPRPTPGAPASPGGPLARASHRPAPRGTDLGAPPAPGVAPSPEPVRAFCKRMKDRFLREGQPGAGQPLEPPYLEGDLRQHHLDGRSGRSADLRRCSLGERREASVGRGRLFQTAPGRSGQVIVVLGKAGAGKSLLLQRLCLDWAEGRLAQFDFVFRFDCRRLSLLRGGVCPDLKALLSHSLGGSCEGIERVHDCLLQNPERVLLLFDGVGDLRGPWGFSPAPGSPSRREAHGLAGVLAALFHMKLLSGCTLLLTGRPKERLPPYFPRVDAVLELAGFSAEQVSLYLARSFEGSAHGEEKADLIRASPYLLSHCANPGLCRFICQAVLEARGQPLPTTLTGLFTASLLQRAAGAEAKSPASRHQRIATLAEVSFSLAQRCQNALLGEQFPSADVKEFALETGLMVEEGGTFAFSNFGVQNFLVALHLTLAKEIKGKKLTKYLGLGVKFRRSLSSWGLVPRFLSGLLFLKEDPRGALLLGEEGESDTEKMLTQKQRTLSRFIRKLPVREFSPDKLLELLHCVRETEDQHLLDQLALALKPELSFLGLALSPPDVSVLHALLRRSPKKSSLDLRGSRLPLEGLRELVGLENVAGFRVSLGEAVALWKRLWDARETGALQAALEKFPVGPFRARSMEDVEALLGLVQLQREMAEGRGDSPGSSGGLIPAMAGLLQLEFSLGPSRGLEGFQRLAESLAAFPALRHLDLDSPDENEIGDEGASALSRVLPRLASLETLNLSRNKITDLGAEPLAGALPALPLLKTLSLYKNNIGDAGVERVAEVLPQMCALRVLDLHCNRISAAGARCLTEHLRRCPRIQSLALWNPTIPHGVLDHLQQLDSRIRRF